MSDFPLIQELQLILEEKQQIEEGWKSAMLGLLLTAISSVAVGKDASDVKGSHPDASNQQISQAVSGASDLLDKVEDRYRADKKIPDNVALNPQQKKEVQELAKKNAPKYITYYTGENNPRTGKPETVTMKYHGDKAPSLEQGRQAAKSALGSGQSSQQNAPQSNNTTHSKKPQAHIKRQTGDW
jgi:hypothetical protein